MAKGEMLVHQRKAEPWRLDSALRSVSLSDAIPDHTLRCVNTGSHTRPKFRAALWPSQ